MRYRKKLVMAACCVLSSILFAGSILPVRTEAADNVDPVVTVAVPVSCKGEDTTETFQYQLQGEASEFEQIETTELELKAGEKGEFSITYTYPGTYHYTVSQTKGTDKYTTYDDTIFNVDVYVTEDENGTLKADPVLYSQGDACKRVELIFKNVRKVPAKNKTNNVAANKKKTSPKKTEKGAVTGDTSGIMVWLAVLIVTGGIIIYNMMKRKHRRREDI